MEGLQFIPLKQHVDDRGRVMEVLRKDDPHFVDFGQAYFSSIYPNVVKAWHAHSKQHDALTVISGTVRMGFYDSREDSKTKGECVELVTGPYNPTLVIIPPLIYHGFKAISGEEALLMNMPSLPYNREEPDELRLPWDDPKVPFSWETKFY